MRRAGAGSVFTVLRRFARLRHRPADPFWLPEDVGERVARTDRALAALEGEPFLFLAGDSHAEFMERVPPAGVAIVNGAVGGTGTAACLHLLRTYRFGRAFPALTILSVGFNDLRNGPDCETPENVRRFGRLADAALRMLVGRSAATLVLAIPPVDPVYNPLMSRTAIETYSRELEARTRAHRPATFIDPFRSIREPDFGTCVPGSIDDGLHVADNRRVWAEVEEACRAHAIPWPVRP